MLKRGTPPSFTLSGGQKILLISCILNTLPSISHAGSCTGAAGNYTCSGGADAGTDVSQLLSGSPLAVTTTPGFGIITGTGDAITLESTGGLIFNDNNQSMISGANSGILAVNSDSGSLSITTTGVVSGLAGVLADNYGSGELSVVTTGSVIGSGDAGIAALNTGTALTVHADNVTGNGWGISATNVGSEKLSIVTTGTVKGVSEASGALGVAISAFNDSMGTDLIIQGVDALGETQGIEAINGGSGVLSITSTGTVAGGSGGMDAMNTGDGLIIEVNNVSGGSSGIFTKNNFNGALSITSTGLVTGGSGTGIDAYNGGTDLTINVVDVSGAKAGIQAVNSSDGVFSVTTRGVVEGTSTIPGEGYGINATNTGSAPLLIMVDATSTVQGGTAAIFTNSTEAFDITNRGSIRNLSRVSSTLAIHNSGNEGTIHNQGLILGTLESANNVINDVGGIWNSAGGSSNFGSFTTANNLVNNGLIITANGTAFDPVQTTTFNNVGTFTNSGSLSMGNGRVGDITVINGDYVGNNGEIVLDTELGDDNSLTDKLQINGNTSGRSFVTFNDLGGNGGKSIEGTELITVSGQSDGEFMHTGRIVAGAYDYFLVRGESANASNWYLSGRLKQAVAQGEPENPMVERPEDGAYTANLAAANTMFVTRLHDRLGETRYLDVLTGEKKVTSLWLRSVGGHNTSRDGSGQLRTRANRYVVQLGGGIAHWSITGQDRFQLGMLAGYGNNKSTTTSSLTGYQAKGKVDGYSTGLYGIWRANDAGKTGMYMDAWMQYSWLNNTVSGEGVAQESYKSKGISASFELGYLFNLGENAANNGHWFIQPQAQVIAMEVKANEHTETNGTRVSGEGHNNTQTRLGVRVFANGYSDLDKGKNRVFQPFVEVNWVYNSKDFGTQLDGVSVKQAGTANIAELKVGVEGQLSQHLNLWGNIAQQVGNKGYSDSAATLGVKYSF